MISYIFDGSFSGLLCCIFRVYEFKDKQVKVVAANQYQPQIFDETVSISSDEQRAQRVWNRLCQKISASSKRNFYLCYLSEQAAAFQALFNFARYVFDNQKAVDKNYGHSDVLTVSQIAKNVSREKHRMEAFVRFKKTAEGIFFAVVNPDFNVLPVIQSHFKNRYADQRWLIYDELRKYGIYYDLSAMHDVTLNVEQSGILNESSRPTSITLDVQEALYDQLWKDYFKSATIVERKNIKLHLQHVPRRYWHYLNEKNS